MNRLARTKICDSILVTCQFFLVETRIPDKSTDDSNDAVL